MLKIENLHFSVGETQILNGIDFEVPAGQTLGIIGPNGSGKTTLFNCISGFNYASLGTIKFLDQEITNLPANTRAKLGLGRVFQNFGIFKEMTVIENVVIALESQQPLSATFFPWNKQNKTNKELALNYLAEVGLQNKASDKAASLSGGQMRLLEIIRTIAFGAKCFLLDEPTAGVSPKMKDDVGQLILKLQKLKQTVLIIEHDINFIQKFCERIIVLNLGKVVLDDTPEKVRANKMLEEIYFGTDQNSAKKTA